jgi:hypothetical protein
MLAILLAVTIALTPSYTEDWYDRTSLPASGLIYSDYGPSLVKEVYENRLAWHQVEPCPQCVGEIVMMRKGDLGRLVWVRYGNGKTVGPLLVIDCSNRRHFADNVEKGLVAEISTVLAVEMDVPGEFYGTIYEEQERRGETE